MFISGRFASPDARIIMVEKGRRMKSEDAVIPPGHFSVSGKLTEAILDFIGNIPRSKVRIVGLREVQARRIASSSASSAALVASALALPPGPFGWLTILPEMVSVWKIQAAMVSDIAAVYGKTATLTREQMLYCLFRHAASQAVRGLVVRQAERFIVRESSTRVVQAAARKIGIKVSQRAIGKGFSRWLPVIGAVGVGAFAYYDTARVASTAIKLFSGEIKMLPAGKTMEPDKREMKQLQKRDG